MACMLAEVLGAIREFTLVRLAQQRIERLVLASAKYDRSEAESDNVFESLDRIVSGRCQSEILWRAGP